MKRAFLITIMSCLGLLLIAGYMGYAEDNNRGHSITNLALSGEVKDGVRIVKVEASKYKFSPDPIVVKFGEKVRLIVTSADVDHGLAISEFKVNVTVRAGKTETADFVANKKGVFRMYCSVYCGSGHGKMRGVLKIVKD